MELQEAYKILGVSEEASDEAIENQYMKWVKRYNSNSTDESLDIESINQAYNTVKSYRYNRSHSEQHPRSLREKINLFFYYYKVHVIVVIIVVLISSSIINTIVNNLEAQKTMANLPPKNISVMLYGDFFNPKMDTSLVSDNILSLVPSWERVAVNVSYFPLEATNSTDVAMQQKSAITLVSDDSDLYITEIEHFEKLVNSGILLPIDEMESSIKGIPEENLLYRETPEDTISHLYGVKITTESIFENVLVTENQNVLAIRKNTDNTDNAMKLVVELTKN
ncbi:J domain-containing protein [Aquibacillus albus]|uniref:J domain-containing protein n=1 Tax=Aquibacillus albus TaxID=1168171 RepID=A0ABS2MW07_9BACI|nr:J domain-containing protein [Aquibacillus albus]MBM7570081.1 hypothetical protein [Aquibacillus albus]